VTEPTSPRPDVSVVIPARDVVPVIGEQLDALVVQDFNGRFEVVVVDNGSRDGTTGFARRWADRLDLRVVDASDGAGVSHARNVGVRSARSDVILICDADDRVSPRWVRRMCEALERFDHVGGPRCLDRLNPPDVIAWYPSHPTDRLSGEDGFLPWAVGSNCGFHRRVFDAIGGYDEGLVGGGDDLDFSWRGQLAGFSIGFAQDAWIDYRLRASLRDLYRQTRLRARGSMRLHDRFSAHGARAPRRRLLSTGWWLLTRAPLAVASRRKRGQWVRSLATMHGRLLR
jgi:glycosyltransferase involved in cell wall biosynthesis